MRISEKDVKKIANLARLKISDDECQALQGELDQILDFVAQLDEVNTDDAQVTQSVARQDLRLRADEPQKQEMPEEILKNSTDSLMLGEGGVFVVPKVVE